MENKPAGRHLNADSSGFAPRTKTSENPSKLLRPIAAPVQSTVCQHSRTLSFFENEEIKPDGSNMGLGGSDPPIAGGFIY